MASKDVAILALNNSPSDGKVRTLIAFDIKNSFAILWQKAVGEEDFYTGLEIHQEKLFAIKNLTQLLVRDVKTYTILHSIFYSIDNPYINHATLLPGSTLVVASYYNSLMMAAVHLVVFNLEKNTAFLCKPTKMDANFKVLFI